MIYVNDAKIMNLEANESAWGPHHGFMADGTCWGMTTDWQPCSKQAHRDPFRAMPYNGTQN